MFSQPSRNMTFRTALRAPLAGLAFLMCATASAATFDLQARFDAWASVRESSLAGDPAALASSYDRMVLGIGKILAAPLRIPAATRATLQDARSRFFVRAAVLRAQDAQAIQTPATVPAPVSPDVIASSNVSPVTVAKADNPDKEISTSALRLRVKVHPDSKNPFTLGRANVTAQLTGYTGSAMVNVYRTDISDRNRLGSAAVTGTAQWVALSSPSELNRVDQETADGATFIITVEGVSPDSTAHTRDWIVRLNDVDLGSLVPSAAGFSNVGTFPIVEVK